MATEQRVIRSISSNALPHHVPGPPLMAIDQPLLHPLDTPHALCRTPLVSTYESMGPALGANQGPLDTYPGFG